MFTSDPPTREGQVWLSQFNAHLMEWVSSGLTDEESLLEMGQALKHLFERSPDYTLQIQSIALSATFLARQGAVRPEASLLAETGLTAATVQTGDYEHSAKLASLQAVFLAEIHLDQGRRLDGLDMLRRARAELASVSEGDAVGLYTEILASSFEGGLHELALEHERAGDAYFDCTEAIQLVLDGDAHSFAGNVMTTIFGDDPMAATYSEMLRPLILHDLHQSLVNTRLGLVRSLHRQSGTVSTQEEVEDAARSAWAAIDEYGMPPDVGVIEVFKAVAALPENERSERVQALIEWSADERDSEASDWRALLLATLSHSSAAKASNDEREDGYELARDSMDPGTSAVVDALVSGMDLVDHANESGEALDEVASDFLFSLSYLLRNDGLSELDLPTKALLDEPVSAATRWAFERYMISNSEDDRMQLGLLVDSLREPRSLPLDPETYEDRSTALEAHWYALDRLQRIAHVIKDRSGTAALALQRAGGETLFISVTGADGISVQRAGAEYAEAAEDLASKAIGALDGSIHSVELADAGRTVFGSLPGPVRDVIDSHGTILLAPDFSSNQDSVPFELIHDGDRFLGLSKVISRLASLRDVARALEPRRLPVERVRALVCTADDVRNMPDLKYAKEERGEICDLLRANGWDAPDIAPTRLTSRFFLERMKYVSLLHVAAHGQVSTGDEALLLSDEHRLTVDELARKRFASVPFAYLNTCLLAHTRYLGGGVTRGIAHTLFQAGAPAVIANLSPVYDKTALDLSRAFYKSATAHNVGEALRLARTELDAAGVSPVSWGTTILIGDPDHMVDVRRKHLERDTTIELLDAYMSSEADDEPRKEAWESALAELSRDPGNRRLAAATAFVLSLNRLDYSVDEGDEVAMDRLIEVADLLDHMPSQTMLRVTKANHLLERHADDNEVLAAIDDAIPWLDVLGEDNDMWISARQRLMAAKKSMELTALGMERIYRGAWSDSHTNAADAMIDILQAIQADSEYEAGAVTLRSNESTLEDIAWNAIVIGYPSRFEDMREQAAFARDMATKLKRRGFLTQDSDPHSQILLAGLLHDLWGRQHSVGLEPELVSGWTGTVLEAINDIANNWSPPEPGGWFEEVQAFARLLEETLEFLDNCTWEEVYNHLDPRFETLASNAVSILEGIRREHAEALAGCYAWLLGCVVTRNTFSPLEGSVPESIGERIDNLALELWGRGQEYLMRYLKDGFESVRNAEWDELQRWKLDITPEEHEALRKRPS